MSLSQDYEWVGGNRSRDHLLQVRDRMLCVLEDVGRAMTPKELAAKIGLGVCATIAHANRWPAYLTVEFRGDDKRRAVSIWLHPHLVRVA